MADTDEASVAFAREAERTLQRVDSDVTTLTALAQSDALTAEFDPNGEI